MRKLGLLLGVAAGVGSVVLVALVWNVRGLESRGDVYAVASWGYLGRGALMRMREGDDALVRVRAWSILWGEDPDTARRELVKLSKDDSNRWASGEALFVLASHGSIDSLAALAERALHEESPVLRAQTEGDLQQLSQLIQVRVDEVEGFRNEGASEDNCASFCQWILRHRQQLSARGRLYYLGEQEE